MSTVITDQINYAMGGSRSTHEDENKKCMKILVGKAEGHRSLGKPMRLTYNNKYTPKHNGC